MNAGDAQVVSGRQPADSEMATRLLDMIGASWMSQAICVAAELHISDLLASGPQTLGELAIATKCPDVSLRRLLRALAALGLCAERSDERFELAPMGSLLRSDTADSVRSWAIWWGKHLWTVWQNLQLSVQMGKSARELTTGRKGYAHVESDTEAAALFNNAMAELTRLGEREVLRLCDLSAATRAVDVGGGYGELLSAVLEAYPAMHGVLFDRPHAIEGARRRITAPGIASRCEFVAGDFFEGVPHGGNVYLLKCILHNWDDARAAAILRNCRVAMSGRGKLVLVERMLPARMADSARDRAIARTDLNMLVGLGGRERTRQEFDSILADAGLRATRIMPAAGEYTVIECVCDRGSGWPSEGTDI